MTRLLGAQSQDEDFPPEDPDDVDPNLFDFHGFGPPHNPFEANPANGPDVAWAPWLANNNDLNSCSGSESFSAASSWSPG